MVWSMGRKRWITDWWPNRLNLSTLKPKLNPYGKEFDYIEELKKLELDSVIKDLKELMKKS